MSILLHGASGQVSRSGIVAMRVKWYCDTLIEALHQIPEKWEGLLYMEGSLSQAEEGEQYVATALYEGKDGVLSKRYLPDFSPSMTEQPIGAHPRLLSLLEKWGGTIDVDGKISWQTTAPTQSTGVGSSGDKERQNPALGITKYRVPNGMLKISRIVDQLPSDLYSQVGRIRRTVPRSDGLPTPDNRYWLTHMPQVSRKGAVWEVIDNYELTDEMTADQLRFARDVYRDAL